MKKANKRTICLIFGLVVAVLFMNLPVIYTYFYHQINGTPKAVKGSIDLSTVSPASEKIYLDGQWEFYWKHFIISDYDQLSLPDMTIAVPDEWSKYKVQGKNLPAEGYGSYKLRLTGLQAKNAVTLCIPDFGGAYKVFIDGKLTAQSGTVSKDIAGIFTAPKVELFPVVLPDGTNHEVVIEVATTRFCGLYMTPVLSDYNKTVSENTIRNIIRYTLFGITLFLFLSLMTIYVVSIRRKLYSFWLPVMILFILIRTMLTSEFYSVWQPVLFFNLPYESTNELMYFATFVLKYLLIFLVQEQCGIKFEKRERVGFLVYYIFLYLIYLFVPNNIYNQYLSVSIPTLTYVLDFYLFYKIYCSRENMKKFGMVVFWGAISVIAGLTLDSYYINGKIYMNMSLQLLIFFTVFAVIMNWVYVMRSIDIYDDFIKSSSRLELARSQIAMQKEYYDALSRQMNEIREIKHDIRHFIGVMSILAEENKLDELKAFLNEYGKKTEMDKLPVFCNNVVANSIIGYYYLQAKESGIVFESRCNISSKSVMSDSDLCIVLGNSLENAVNACRQIEDIHKRFISIEAMAVKKQQIIKIKNSHNGKLIMKDSRYITSKDTKSHGLGIRNIEKVIESYGGFVKIDHNENEFTVMVAVSEK